MTKSTNIQVHLVFVTLLLPQPLSLEYLFTEMEGKRGKEKKTI